MDSGLVRGRIGRQIGRVIGQGYAFDMGAGLGKHMRQGHFAEFEVVSVSLSIRGQGQQPTPGRRGKFLPEAVAVAQQPLKSHGLGKGAIVKIYGNAASRG